MDLLWMIVLLIILLITGCNKNENEIVLVTEAGFAPYECYKDDDKTILYDDIDSIVLKSFSDNVFSLIDAIMNRNRKKAISLYQDLLKNGEDVNKILSLLCDQFRMIYNGKILLKEHNNNYKEEGPLPEHTRRRQQGDAQTRYKMCSVTGPRRAQT